MLTGHIEYDLDAHRVIRRMGDNLDVNGIALTMKSITDHLTELHINLPEGISVDDLAKSTLHCCYDHYTDNSGTQRERFIIYINGRPMPRSLILDNISQICTMGERKLDVKIEAAVYPGFPFDTLCKIRRMQLGLPSNVAHIQALEQIMQNGYAPLGEAIRAAVNYAQSAYHWQNIDKETKSPDGRLTGKCTHVRDRLLPLLRYVIRHPDVAFTAVNYAYKPHSEGRGDNSSHDMILCFNKQTGQMILVNSLEFDGDRAFFWDTNFESLVLHYEHRGESRTTNRLSLTEPDVHHVMSDGEMTTDARIQVFERARKEWASKYGAGYSNRDLIRRALQRRSQ